MEDSENCRNSKMIKERETKIWCKRSIEINYEFKGWVKSINKYIPYHRSDHDQTNYSAPISTVLRHCAQRCETSIPLNLEGLAISRTCNGRLFHKEWHLKKKDLSSKWVVEVLGSRPQVSDLWSKCVRLRRLLPSYQLIYSGVARGSKLCRTLWKRTRSLSLKRCSSGGILACLHLLI